MVLGLLADKFDTIWGMKSNAEFRELAWKRLWADHWFGRLFGGWLLLMLCGYAVQVVLDGVLGRLDVQSWFDYLETVAVNRQDLTTPVPQLTPEYISQACSSTALILFFSFIMAGIASYGSAGILKKCLANDEQNWLSEAFGGFKYPFGMLWLQLRYWLIFFFWGILAGIPLGVAIGFSVPIVKHFADSHLPLVVGIVTVVISLGLCAMFAIYGVPFYRYRFLWLVKAEHPEWSAGECIAASRKLMKGNKLKSFKLDCSYWKPLTLMLLPVLTTVAVILLDVLLLQKGEKMLPSLLGLVGAFAFLASVAACIVIGQYIGVGQGFFYEELKQMKLLDPSNR